MQAAVELQIKEFGQTPRQLFQTPHPRKVVVPAVERPVQVSAIQRLSSFFAY